MSSEPFARLTSDPSTAWLTAPPRRLTKRPNDWGPVLWIDPVSGTFRPSTAPNAPTRVSAGHAPRRRAGRSHVDAPGAPVAVKPAGSVSVKRSIGVSVAGWEIVVVTSGEVPAVGGVSPTVSSGKNAA